MTDPVFALVLILCFLALMAALHFFKTLDNDVLRSWRTPMIAGVAAGVLLWLFARAGFLEVATGVLLSATALYVRLMGRESESIDGMLLGACTGAAAAVPLSLGSGDVLIALASCIAAGAVAGYGITFAAFHVADTMKQFLLDAVTFLAAIALAFAPRALVRAGLSPREIAVAVTVLIPLIVLGAIVKQWPEIRAELRHEASLGFMSDADVRRTAHPILRLGGGGWADRAAHREFVRLANRIALRKRQQRNRAEETARLYQLEIIKLRMQLQEMSRIDRAMLSQSAEPGSDADTMAHSK